MRFGEVKLHYNEETKRHIELRFVQRIIDVEEETVVELPFRAKECSEEDYSGSESQRDIYDMN